MDSWYPTTVEIVATGKFKAVMVKGDFAQFVKFTDYMEEIEGLEIRIEQLKVVINTLNLYRNNPYKVNSLFRDYERKMESIEGEQP